MGQCGLYRENGRERKGTWHPYSEYEFQTRSKLEQGTSFPSQTLWLPNGACNSQQLQESSFLLSQGLEQHIPLCLKHGMELEFSNRGLKSRLDHHLNHIFSSKKIEKFCSVILPQCLKSLCFLNNLLTCVLDRLMSRLIARVTGGKSNHSLYFSFLSFLLFDLSW